MILFSFRSPNTGIGHDELKLDPHDAKESTNPESVWSDLACECVEHGISLSLVVGFGSHGDLNQLSVLPRITGGDILYYPCFERGRDEYSFINDVQRLYAKEV